MKKAKCHPNSPLFCKGLCKPCYNKRWYYKHQKENNEKDRKRSKVRWKDKDKEKKRLRPYQIMASHGIVETEYDSKLASQNNLCGLCHKPFYGVGREKGSPVLDHSHASGKLRDFIHRECNTALGLLNEDPAICRSMADYIERHGVNNV